MAVAINLNPQAGSDGIPYALAVPLTAQEADLNGGANVPTSPVQVDSSEAILAVVTLSINGLVVANNSYVVMQVDLGDGMWVDVCWCVWTGSQGQATFVMSNGIAGANVFQQTRQAGGFPASNGQNQMVLGGRIRFVGKAVFSGGSSSLAGITTSVIASIRYRLLKLR